MGFHKFPFCRMKISPNPIISHSQLITQTIVLLFVSNVLQSQLASAYMIGRNPYRRSETLDPQGKYQLEWLVDWSSNRITFNVTVETKGYVGFGLSRNGKMSGADIVIGGVSRTGKPYFSDRHAVGNHLPELDESQDWTLHDAWQTQTHTCLSFSRDLDTCDPDDYPITTNKISLIWAFGERDSNITYHYENRGVHDIYLLDPDYTPQITRDPTTHEPTIVDEELRSETKLWSIPRRLQIPSDDTSYLCTMHRGPKLRKKHHVIGYHLEFANEESKRHTHHIIIYKCTPPPGVSARSLFEHSIGLHNRQQCYSLSPPRGPMRTEFCTHYLGWAIGQRMYFNPPHVGYPFGESSDEYYVAQVHYNNPERRSDIVVDLSLELYYTDKLRPHDASIVVVGHEVPGQASSILVPPSTPRHKVFGHCSADCSQRILPKEGITVFASALHSHNSGRELRLQQFRGRRELPWIHTEDNYGNDFQQIRSRREEAKYLPGDHLAMSCVYDNTWTNGTVVGGFSTRQEMCLAFVYYYTKIPGITYCLSGIESEENRRRFLGVRNVTWDESQLEYIVETPANLAGLRVSQVSDNLVKWDLGKRTALQRFHEYSHQEGKCGRDEHAKRFDGEDVFSSPTGYPYEAKPYQPERSCSFRQR